MASVTNRIKQIKQPRGGYINPKEFLVTTLDDKLSLHMEENIHASLVGLAVDYLTRFCSGTSIQESFDISLKGAYVVEELDYAIKLCKNIKGLDDKSIENACKMTGYDVAFRAGRILYTKPVKEIKPDKETIENIKIMVNRSLEFWRKYGVIIKDGFTFEGGYTDIVDTGDGDFLTKDTLWDFKVSKSKPTNKHTLQLLMYYIMGKHSIHSEFDTVNKIGIFNPRLNQVYTLEIDKVDKEIIKEVERDVIGYK